MENLFTFKLCPCRQGEGLLSTPNYEQCFTCGAGNATIAYGAENIQSYLDSMSKAYRDLSIVDEKGDVFIPYYNDIDTHLIFLDTQEDEYVYKIVKKSDLGKDKIVSEKFKFQEFTKLYLRINELVAENNLLYEEYIKDCNKLQKENLYVLYTFYTKKEFLSNLNKYGEQ